MRGIDSFAEICSPADCASNYGSSMFVSSAADWVELASLALPPLPLADVVDYIVDCLGGKDSYSDSYLDIGQEEPERHDLNEGIRNMLESRERLLNDSYPFRIDGFRRCVLKDGYSLEHSHYLLLLCLSALKGWGDNNDMQSCTKLFEHVVNQSLLAAGFESAVMGTSSEGTFKERLETVGAKLKLDVDYAAAPRSAKAKDDGVDVIAGHFWHDGRKGELVILVQAACGKESGGAWEGKLSAVPIPSWRLRFLESLNPYAYLAIPYHLTSDAEKAVLSSGDSHSFIDRIRLVKLSGGRLQFPPGPEEDMAVQLVQRASALFRLNLEPHAVF